MRGARDKLWEIPVFQQLSSLSITCQNEAYVFIICTTIAFGWVIGMTTHSLSSNSTWSPRPKAYVVCRQPPLVSLTLE